MDPQLLLKPLLGAKIVSTTGLQEGSHSATLCTADGRVFTMWHSQDCCESVMIHSIKGCFSKLINSKVKETYHEILSGEDPQGMEGASDGSESWTWTIFRITTCKGTVEIHWLGSSNGYYSEGVDFIETTSKHP